MAVSRKSTSVIILVELYSPYFLSWKQFPLERMTDELWLLRLGHLADIFFGNE